ILIYYASHPLSVALTIYGSPNNHILHSLLMHFAYRMFGSAEWALRLPALLAGIAIVPLTYVAVCGGQTILSVGTGTGKIACPPHRAERWRSSNSIRGTAWPEGPGEGRKLRCR